MLAASCCASRVGGSRAIGQGQRRPSLQPQQPGCRRPCRHPALRPLAFRGQNGSASAQLQATPDQIHATKVPQPWTHTGGAELAWAGTSASRVLAAAAAAATRRRDWSARPNPPKPPLLAGALPGTCVPPVSRSPSQMINLATEYFSELMTNGNTEACGRLLSPTVEHKDMVGA